MTELFKFNIIKFYHINVAHPFMSKALMRILCSTSIDVI